MSRLFAIQYAQYRIVGNSEGEGPFPAERLSVADGILTVTCISEYGPITVHGELFEREPQLLNVGLWHDVAQTVVACPEPLVVTSWEGDPQPPALTPHGGLWSLRLYVRTASRVAVGTQTVPAEEHLLHLWPG